MPYTMSATTVASATTNESGLSGLSYRDEMALLDADRVACLRRERRLRDALLDAEDCGAPAEALVRLKSSLDAAARASSAAMDAYQRAKRAAPVRTDMRAFSLFK